MMSDKITTLNENNFNEFVEGVVPSLVDFWAAWCGPCKMVSPVVDEIANIFQGDLRVGKVNVDENPSIASSYGVMNIPTLILFRNGKELQRIVGYHDKEELGSIIKKILDL
ncbi:MAG: thioredoxin [Bacillota bacterium]|nr:thioredoxin [Bacillota bacterium]